MLGFFSIECNFFSYESRMILHVVFFQIDSSSTPNRVTLNNEKYVEGDEEQELMTPNSRGKHKKHLELVEKHTKQRNLLEFFLQGLKFGNVIQE